METFKVKAIIAAVEAKSLAKAAESFSYTPSAFSHLLKNFENEVGVKIFTRSTRGVELTEEGRMLYPKFVKLVECADDVSESIKKIIKKREKTLNISTYSSILHGFLSSFIKDFQALYPDINIVINIDSNLKTNANAKKSDIVFTTEIDVDRTQKIFVPLFEDPFYVIAPEGYLKCDKMLREDLYNENFIISTIDYLENYFDNDKFKHPIHLNSDNGNSVLEMIKTGFGISILPYMHITDLKSGLAKIPLEPKLVRKIGYAYNPESTSPSLAVFLSYIKEYFTDFAII